MELCVSPPQPDSCLLQVFIAALVRGYTYAPEQVNKRWTNWPMGGEPVNELPLRIKKL